MPPTSHFVFIAGTQYEIQQQLTRQTLDGFRPILITAASTGIGAQVFIILEKPVPTSAIEAATEGENYTRCRVTWSRNPAQILGHPQRAKLKLQLFGEKNPIRGDLEGFSNISCHSDPGYLPSLPFALNKGTPLWG